MTLTIELQPEMERSLPAGASAKGLSLTAFAQEVLAREASPEVDLTQSDRRLAAQRLDSLFVSVVSAFAILGFGNN